PPKMLLVQRTVSLPSFAAPAITASSEGFFGGVCAQAGPKPTAVTPTLAAAATTMALRAKAMAAIRIVMGIVSLPSCSPARDGRRVYRCRKASTVAAAGG